MQKPQPGAKGGLNAVSGDATTMCFSQHDEHSQRIQAQRKRNAARPMPQMADMRDFMHANQWEALTSSDAADDEPDALRCPGMVGHLPADEPSRLQKNKIKTQSGKRGVAKHQSQRMRKMVDRQDERAMQEAMKENQKVTREQWSAIVGGDSVSTGLHEPSDVDVFDVCNFPVTDVC